MSLLFHVTPRRSLAAVLAEGLRPRIGPRAAACGEARLAVWLFPSREALEDAMGSWLWDAFEDEPALLAVMPDPSWRIEQGPGWECRVIDPIPPEALVLLSENLGEAIEIPDLPPSRGTALQAAGDS